MSNSRRQPLLDRLRLSVDRKHLLELIMTVGIIAMSIALVALMLLRFVGDRNAAKKPEPEEERVADLGDHNEIKLGEFKVMTASLQQMSSADASNGVDILEFQAAVMVQNGSRSQDVQESFRQYRNRLQSTVDSATRNATDEELRDPGLDGLRGRIRTNVNQLLGRDVVDDVVVSGFRHYRL